MATAFNEAHADQIPGCLTTVDRLIIHGHLTLLWRPGAFPTFVLRQGIRFGDFGRYVWKITDRVKKHAKRIAKEPADKLSATACTCLWGKARVRGCAPTPPSRAATYLRYPSSNRLSGTSSSADPERDSAKPTTFSSDSGGGYTLL